jgi:hypothetical protein
VCPKEVGAQIGKKTDIRRFPSVFPALLCPQREDFTEGTAGAFKRGHASYGSLWSHMAAALLSLGLIGHLPITSRNTRGQQDRSALRHKQKSSPARARSALPPGAAIPLRSFGPYTKSVAAIIFGVLQRNLPLPEVSHPQERSDRASSARRRSVTSFRRMKIESANPVAINNPNEITLNVPEIV